MSSLSNKILTVQLQDITVQLTTLYAEKAEGIYFLSNYKTKQKAEFMHVYSSTDNYWAPAVIK